MIKKKGKIDGRPTEQITSSEIISMPGTKGGVRARINKTMDVEYALPKASNIRGDYTVRGTPKAAIDKKVFDERFDLIDWSK